MVREKKRTKKVKTSDESIEKTIDPYTGELKPVPQDADRFIEVVPRETTDRRGSNYLLNEESSMDNYAADADADTVAEGVAHYTEDEDLEDDEELQDDLDELEDLDGESSEDEDEEDEDELEEDDDLIDVDSKMRRRKTCERGIYCSEKVT